MLATHLDLIWTSPLTRDPVKLSAWPTGFLAGAWAETPDGALIMFGAMIASRYEERLLLRNAERSGPEAAIPLMLPASEPPGLQRIPQLLFRHRPPNLYKSINSIAIGTDGAIWMGGAINSSMSFASARHGDAYLAKLDMTGRTIWQQAYSDGRILNISSIALTDMGGAIVAGSDATADTAWLARIGPDGIRLQEWRLGTGKGIRVIRLRDGRTLVVGVAYGGLAAASEPHRDAGMAAAKAGTYRDDVVAWMLSETGQLQGPLPIREGISQGSAIRGPGVGGGSIDLAVAGDAAYVATNWRDSSRPAGIEVARIGPDGIVAWRQRLPETVTPMDETRSFSCSPSVAALSNGDALVACALNGQVQIHLLDSKTGERRFARLAPPPCQKGGYGSSASVIACRDGTVFVRGAGFADEGDVGCSWMARLTFGGG